jgi:uncharacterized protein
MASKRLKISIALNLILMILLGVSITFLITLYTENRELKNKLGDLKNKLELVERQLEYYMAISSYMVNTTTLNVSNGGFGTIKYHAVAVAKGEGEYFGIVLNFTISLVPGTGKILVNTQPKIGIDLQTSLEIARKVAADITGYNFSEVDIILSIEAPHAVDVVDGPSAGAAITVALVSLLLNRSIDMSIYVTGTINPDGSIGKVGGILEKGTAAAENGGEIFIVPHGQENVTIYVRVEREIVPGFYLITYEPRTINVQEYLSEKGYTITVVSVSNIRDLLSYVWGG